MKQSPKSITAPEHDSFLFHEMMAHPVLFTHPKPQKIAIIDNHEGILDEVLKHENITDVCCINNHPQQNSQDKRVRYQALDSLQWLSHEADAYDIIIQSETKDNFLEQDFGNYFRALKTDGLFIQSYPISLLQLNELKPVYDNLKHAGFTDWQLMLFPQPSYPTGCRVAIMAAKNMLIKPITEKNIFNRNFATRYYNFDMHRAALAVPEFAKQKEML